ncbi:host cell division inhibitor Icd-like protein [Salmonella enterica]|nr:host cell division inhibitor Icd-like protein [Salmonella enterica]EAR5545557.1 host cell division inhibitor Icd-like protein [Salmonella enterica]EAT3229570.1 host cell division inhibitor Icd-like protein [Salmonella enterica]ECK2646005.1 host cell division inhibitor Icd-like protein [Salmonella enterica]ECK5791439.1 host cell division inhibitor Icd-like protein [Salmonella enterica]
MAGRGGEASACWYLGRQSANPATSRHPCLAASGETPVNVQGAAKMAESAHPKFIWRFYSPRTNQRTTVTASTETEARSRLHNPSCLFSARIRITEGVYQVLAHLHLSTGERDSFLLPDLFADHQQAERLASAAAFNFSFPGHTGNVTCEVVEVRHA